MALLRNELSLRSDQYSAELLELLECAHSTAERLCASVAVGELPRWFLPVHELDLDQAAPQPMTKATVSVARGKWLGSAVTVQQLEIPSEAFAAKANTWFSMSHPNVIKLFGASHLRPPCSVVFENVVSTNLREYLSADETHHLLWPKLYEVALGLKYLHERGVVLGNLQCSNIWVGTDGVAKISGLGAGNTGEESGILHQGIRWRSPECLKGEPATAASDIYSFGICIAEALSGSIPWSDKSDGELVSLVTFGHRPQLPEDTKAPQRRLIEKMWLYDSLKRSDIAIVVEQLKAFAEKSVRSRGQTERPDLQNPSSSPSAPANLGTHVFPEFGSTIQGYLRRLQSKCDLCRDPHSRASELYIHERLAALHARLAEDHRGFRDIAVARFCEVLLSFDGFLRIAVSEKSVLQRAKSQKVSLENSVLHRQIDEVLALLPQMSAGSTDPVHDWQQRAKPNDAGSERQKEPEQTSEVGGGPVKLSGKESERMNRNFQQLDLDFDESQSPDTDAQHPSWFIALHQLKYNRDQAIGEGAFGAVYRATWLSTPVVVKFMGYAQDGGEYNRRLFLHELRIWLPLNHPHVVKLYGAGHLGKRYFVCEFAGKGALLDYLKKAENQFKTWQKLHEVALGLQYLHEQNIIHNDLKCDNFLVGGDERTKIIDFGLSCIPNVAEVKIDSKSQGAVHWRAPEYLRGEKSTLASDVYAFGMCILEAVTGSPPWGNALEAAVRFQVLRKGNLPQRPDVLKDDNQWRLIEMMCAKEPSQRLRIPSIVERLHEFAQQEAAAAGAQNVSSSAPVIP